MQLSTAVQNGRLNSIEGTIGNSPKLQLRSGNAPANCAAAATGTLLASIDLPADWLADAANGVKAKAGTWTGNGLAAGTVGHYRIVDAAGTTCHIQGPVSDTSGSAELKMDNTNVANGQAVTVNTFTITDGNG